MKPTTLNLARALRDTGIDAMAALDSGVYGAIADLSDEDAKTVKRLIGSIMGEVVDKLINPATRAFPELNVDAAGWILVAKERASARSTRAG